MEVAAYVEPTFSGCSNPERHHVLVLLSRCCGNYIAGIFFKRIVGRCLGVSGRMWRCLVVLVLGRRRKSESLRCVFGIALICYSI